MPATPSDVAAEPLRTPDNTPVPGGGRWEWCADARNWRERADDSTPPLSITEPVSEE